MLWPRFVVRLLACFLCTCLLGSTITAFGQSEAQNHASSLAAWHRHTPSTPACVLRAHNATVLQHATWLTCGPALLPQGMKMVSAIKGGASCLSKLRTTLATLLPAPSAPAPTAQPQPAADEQGADGAGASSSNGSGGADAAAAPLTIWDPPTGKFAKPGMWELLSSSLFTTVLDH